MSELEQVSHLLAERFKQDGERGRIVFWLDEENQYADEVASLVGEASSDETLRTVELIEPDHTPFNVRYTMFIERPESKFLVYLHGEQPSLQDDWLLDLKLAYGPLFSADKLTMIVNELVPGASDETRESWLDAMRKAPKFFDSTERVRKLAKRLQPNDDATDFQAKMIAVLLGLPDTQHSLQDIWMVLLRQYAQDDDSGIRSIEHMGLGDFHWQGTRFIYHFPVDADEDAAPSVKGFLLWLLDLAWRDFNDGMHASTYYANIMRDYANWSHNVTFRDSLRALTDVAADELQMMTQIDAMDVEELSSHDTFRAVDDVLIHRLLQRVEARSITDEDVQRIVSTRTPMLWYDRYADTYAAISSASTLWKKFDDAQPFVDALASPEHGFKTYVEHLYRVDQAYRHFCVVWQKTKIDTSHINEELERKYVAFQLELGKAWQQQIDSMDRWHIENVDQQWDFFENEVRSFTRNKRKVAVIISDALRYEVGEEFCRRMNTKSRFNVTIDARLSVLPSYTQLGMAALLPHNRLALDGKDHYKALVDGADATGTKNRNTILSQEQGCAVTADDLAVMNRDEARELVKSHDVLYVYHDRIDGSGEGDLDVFDACTATLKQLEDIVKRLTNANVNNILVTADHGFLYQESKLEASEWLSEQPHGAEIWQLKRRFVIGRGLERTQAFTTFTAEQVGLDNPGVDVQVPNSILRLRKQGYKGRYTHGGASLQEIVVPVVHINKSRSKTDDARAVGFTINQTTDRLTSGQLTVDLMQTEAVGGKIQSRTVFVGLYGHDANGNDVPISNEVPIAFDITSREPSERHRSATLLLTNKAEQFNDTMVELHIRERIEGTNQMRMLEPKALYHLQRGSLFDDAGFFDEE